MANTSLENNVLMYKLFGGDNAPPMPSNPNEGGKPKDPKAAEQFGNWADSTDTKVMAQDLAKRGLTNADQLILDNPDQSDPNSIRNSQSDWKTAAIQKILSKAYEAGIKNPTAFLAPENRDYLLSGLDPRIKDAIKDPYFQQIHPNFWSVLGESILPQQWAKEVNKNPIVKK